jgi:hypothetical protein
MATARPVHVFTVPPKLAESTGVKTLGLKTLTSDDELTCFKRARAGAPGERSANIAMELAKEALVEADGQKLSTADATVDTFWKELDPRLRQLVLAAYTKIHGAEDGDVDSFLESQTLRVG